MIFMGITTAPLLRQFEQKKLIFLVTDGEPADIDVHYPQYLRYDTKKAVEELATRGGRTFCLTLDPHADDYVSCLFGGPREPPSGAPADAVRRPYSVNTGFLSSSSPHRKYPCVTGRPVLSVVTGPAGHLQVVV
jgi:hypothetical protein